MESALYGVSLVPGVTRGCDEDSEHMRVEGHAQTVLRRVTATNCAGRGPGTCSHRKRNNQRDEVRKASAWAGSELIALPLVPRRSRACLRVWLIVERLTLRRA